MHIYRYIYMYMYMNIHTQTQTHICKSVCVSTYTHAHTLTHTHTLTHNHAIETINICKYIWIKVHYKTKVGTW